MKTIALNVETGKFVFHAETVEEMRLTKEDRVILEKHDDEIWIAVAEKLNPPKDSFKLSTISENTLKCSPRNFLNLHRLKGKYVLDYSEYENGLDWFIFIPLESDNKETDNNLSRTE